MRNLSKLLLLALFIAGQSFGATCKISEYATLVIDETGRTVPVAREPAVTSQSVTYTTDTDSATFNERTRFVRIVCDAKAHFVFGSGAITATANSPYLAADTAEYFGLPNAGSTWKVSLYDGTS